MAVDNDLYRATEDLILGKPRRRFRTGIRWQHWQLRSLIGTDGQYVYFPIPSTDNKNCTIQRLNTKTRETETVKRLSFNPRCLVARNGWICCGGDLGMFTSFRVAPRASADETDRRFDLEADDRLPLSLDLSDPVSVTLAEARLEKNLMAQSTGFGKEMVNGITLWFPSTLVEPHAGAYDQGVAVLAHNDCSVVVVSLRDQEALDKIKYPDYMNRGVISPDGQLLIAISDDPYLYIHQRTEKRLEDGTRVRAGGRPVYEWTACGRIQLKSQRQDDRSGNRGSFAACFSSTGDFLAVGTQYGVISIFDVSTLATPGVDSLLTTFTASRPNAEFGAVRDMAFSPGPADLLAWTEDRGRVGVADIRTCFDARQILHLDRDDDFESFTVIDRGTIDPRLLEQRGDRGDSLLASFANAIESRRSEGQGSLSRYNIPLSAEETAVLEAIQDFRRRQDQYNPATNRSGTESGSNSSTSGAAGGGNGSGSGTGSAASRPPWAERASRATEGGSTRERTASVSRAVNEILDNIRDQRERIRDSQARLRAREDNNASTERRRYAANPLFGVNAASGATGTGTSGRGALVSRLMANTTNPTSAGSWDNVEALAAFLMREYEETTSRRVLGTYMTSHPRPGPYDTAGLAWSEDGEVLYVGAENGIYEFRVNTFARSLYPSITLS